MNEEIMYKTGLKLEDILPTYNVAEDLSTEVLQDIGKHLCADIRIDDESRAEWVKASEEWLKLASMVSDGKSWPWPGAADIKWPILAIAATQFAARAYASLLPGENYVRFATKGRDLLGNKASRAIRLGKFMSWQLRHEMKNWEKDMDRMLHILPLTGVTFKKTYFDPYQGYNVSEMIHPLDFIVNYNAKCLDSAERKTHVISYSKNDMESYIRSGLFIRPENKMNVGKPSMLRGKTNNHGPAQKIKDPVSANSMDHTCYECHCWLDLDEDGYQEPYIVTLHAQSEQVLRIRARFREEDVEQNDKGEIVRIRAKKHFSSWIFIPDFNSNIYGLGFGHLLGRMNEAVNTLANQLIDAGTLSNLQGGYIGANLMVEGGDDPFSPGEWKIVQMFGDDIRKQIVPLPVKEPSAVLFNLLSLLENSAMKMASVTDIMTGDIPGQNVKATVAMAAIEQGMKVFSSIYKRCHRSTTEEFELLFKLNSEYLDIDTYSAVLDEGNDDGKIGPEDFSLEDFDVYPVSDPSITSEQMKIMKLEALGPLLQLGLNTEEYKRRFVEATEQPNPEALLEPNPSMGPPPEEVRADQELQWKIQKEQSELAHKQRMDLLNARLRALEIDNKDNSDRVKNLIALMDADAAAQEKEVEAQLKFINEMRTTQREGLDAVLQVKEATSVQEDQDEMSEQNSSVAPQEQM